MTAETTTDTTSPLSANGDASAGPPDLPPRPPVEQRACKLCGKPILIANDVRTGKKVALDVGLAPVLAAVRTERGVWAYDAKNWLQAARALANEEVFDGHLRDTLRFAVDHALVCKGRPEAKDASP